MSITKFSNIILLSNKKIGEEIIKTENELFNLTFKKATRQPFKSHEIKKSKRQLSQLKTLLTLRLQDLEEKARDKLDKLFIN